MTTNEQDDDATLPNLRRAANDETRANATSPGKDQRPAQEGNGPDLRRQPGQGGGGLSSESSRSKD